MPERLGGEVVKMAKSKIGSQNNLIKTSCNGILACVASTTITYLLCRYLPEEIIIKLLKYSIGIIGIVWAFSMLVYNKLWDVTDLAGLDYRQHRNIEIEIRSRLQWFWLRALFLGLLALTMAMPAIVSEAKYVVPSLLIYIASCAFALALFSLRGLWAELEEIRELKSYVKEIERLETERANQVKSLKDGLKEDWTPDSQLDGFRNDSSRQGT